MLHQHFYDFLLLVGKLFWVAWGSAAKSLAKDVGVDFLPPSTFKDKLKGLWPFKKIPFIELPDDV